MFIAHNVISNFLSTVDYFTDFIIEIIVEYFSDIIIKILKNIMRYDN